MQSHTSVLVFLSDGYRALNVQVRDCSPGLSAFHYLLPTLSLSTTDTEESSETPAATVGSGCLNQRFTPKSQNLKS